MTRLPFTDIQTGRTIRYSGAAKPPTQREYHREFARFALPVLGFPVVIVGFAFELTRLLFLVGRSAARDFARWARPQDDGATSQKDRRS